MYPASNLQFQSTDVSTPISSSVQIPSKQDLTPIPTHSKVHHHTTLPNVTKHQLTDLLTHLLSYSPLHRPPDRIALHHPHYHHDPTLPSSPDSQTHTTSSTSNVSLNVSFDRTGNVKASRKIERDLVLAWQRRGYHLVWSWLFWSSRSIACLRIAYTV